MRSSGFVRLIFPDGPGIRREPGKEAGGDYEYSECGSRNGRAQRPVGVGVVPTVWE